MVSIGSIILWDLQTGSRRIVLEDGPRSAKATRLLSRRGTAGLGPRRRTSYRLWDLNTRRKRQVFARTCTRSEFDRFLSGWLASGHSRQRRNGHALDGGDGPTYGLAWMARRHAS